MAGGAIALAGGCMQTQEIDQTLPPYASISDEGRDPANLPKPQASDDSCGVMCSIGSAIVSPFRDAVRIELTRFSESPRIRS